mgnify:CR=1 FL=1
MSAGLLWSAGVLVGILRGYFVNWLLCGLLCLFGVLNGCFLVLLCWFWCSVGLRLKKRKTMYERLRDQKIVSFALLCSLWNVFKVVLTNV